MVKKFIFLFCFILVNSVLYANTYYVDNSALNDSGTGAIGSPKKYIRSGIALMSGGDTLIIANGTYTGVNNMLNNGSGWEWNSGLPNGSSGAYTTIKAETDFGVTIDGEGISLHIPLYIAGVSYIKIQGINFINSGGGTVGHNMGFQESHHIKVVRCSGGEGAGNDGNMVFRYCQYSLMEECFTYGQSRYQFMNYDVLTGQTDSYNIFRRCVARFDYDVTPEGQTRPKACFTSYWSPSTIYQNCIAIDAKNASTDADDLIWGAYYAPNGGTSGLRYYSSIALNVDTKGINFEDSNDGAIIDNCVIWGIPAITIAGDRHNAFNSNSATNVTITNSTFGNVVLGDAYSGIRLSTSGNTIKNSIFYDFTGVLSVLSASGQTHDYNAFYGNTGNFASGSASANELCSENGNAVNPLSNGLNYITRIETSSTLKTSGESGGQIGAEILYKLGNSESLYNESGWNALTNDRLWPFPNEDIIRTKMRSYTSHSVEGTRGFCADGETLTHYIWNYLGNVGTGEEPWLEAGALTITTTTLSSGTVGTAYSASVSASGGTSPYSYEVTSGSLPNGLSMSSAGAISGTPTTEETSTFTVTVTDSAETPATDTQELSLTISSAGEETESRPILKGRFSLTGRFSW